MQPNLATIMPCAKHWAIDIGSIQDVLTSHEIRTVLSEKIGTTPSIEAGGSIVEFGGVTIAIISHSVPLPVDQLVYGPRPNPIWDIDPSQLAAAKAHVRVLVLDKPQTRTELVKAERLLAGLTAAICEASKPLAVLWCPSDNLVNAVDFVSTYYRRLEANADPIEIYVRLVGAKIGDKFALATHGLSPFSGGRELEFDGLDPANFNPAKTIDCALRIADFLFAGATETTRTFKSGETVKPGQAVGSENFVVTLESSGVITKSPIYKMTIADGSRD